MVTSNIKTKFLRGEASFGFWNLIQKGLTFAIAFLIIRFLSVRDYGVYLLIISFFNIVRGFIPDIDAVIKNDVIRYIGEGSEAKAKRLFWQLFLYKMLTGLFLMLVVFFGANIIAEKYDPGTANLFRIISPWFLIASFYEIMRDLFMARAKFSAISRRSSTVYLAKLIFIVIFIYFGIFSVKTLLLAVVLSVFVATVVYVPAFFRIIRPWFAVKSDKANLFWQILKTYGKWPILSRGLAVASVNIRPWLIKVFLGTETVAVYNIALSMYGALSMILPTNTLASLVPSEINNQERLKKIYNYSIKYLTVFSVLIGVFGLIFSFPVINYVFPKYAESLPLFGFMVIAIFFSGLSTTINVFLTTFRKQKFLFLLNFIVSISSLIILLIFLPIWGVWGLPLEFVLSPIISLLVSYLYLVKIKPFSLHDSDQLFSFRDYDKELSGYVFRGILKVLKIKKFEK